MAGESITIAFVDVTAAEANRLGNTLADALLRSDPNIIVDRQRESGETQDFGATIGVILGTAAATTVARGIAAWLARNSGAKIEIRRGGKVVLTATHITSKDIPRIAEAFSETD